MFCYRWAWMQSLYEELWVNCRPAMGKQKVPDLYRAPFPLYSIKVDPKAGLVVIAGGGGPSKTGIKNSVVSTVQKLCMNVYQLTRLVPKWFLTVLQHFLELQLVGESQYSASLLHSHDTDTRATMNLALGDGVIAAGQDGTCTLMKVDDCTQKSEGKAAANDGM